MEKIKIFQETGNLKESGFRAFPTVSEHQYHTPSKEKRRFLYFSHLSKAFLEQMIPHLKAPI